jgi:hypothetical protein
VLEVLGEGDELVEGCSPSLEEAMAMARYLVPPLPLGWSSMTAVNGIAPACGRKPGPSAEVQAMRSLGTTST